MEIRSLALCCLERVGNVWNQDIFSGKPTVEKHAVLIGMNAIALEIRH